MCNPAVVGWVITAVATVAQGYQQKQAGKFQEDVAKYNARNLENQAEKVRAKGVEEENILRRQAADLKAEQRAAFGALGIEIDAGSALEVQRSSEILAEVDALRIRSNFEEKALSLEEEASMIRAQGAEAKQAGKELFTGSILGFANTRFKSKFAPTGATGSFKETHGKDTSGITSY